MKVLMLTPYLPYPPSSGGQIRSYNLIKYLSKKHQITLFSLIKYEQEKKYVSQLEKFCQQVFVFKRAEKPWTVNNILKTGFSLHPFLVVRNFSLIEKNAVEEILIREKFDIIHAETFYVSRHIPQTKIPIVLVDQTIEYQVYQHYVENFKFWPIRPIFLIDVLKIKYWETYYWKKASRVVAVSERDAKLMKQLVKDLKVTVVPNGVGEDLLESVPAHYNQTLLFMGNYAWLQNIEAANILVKQVFPKVLRELPSVSLKIAGQNIEKISNLASDKIELVNLEIDDIEGVKKAYQTSGVLVAPLYGPGGTRLKILAAMAAKLPVVTTSIGIEGIDAINNKSVLFGETPADLANLTVKILRDRFLYNKIVNQARDLVDQKYSYRVIAEKLDKLYQETGSG